MCAHKQSSGTHSVMQRSDVPSAATDGNVGIGLRLNSQLIVSTTVFGFALSGLLLIKRLAHRRFVKRSHALLTERDIVPKVVEGTIRVCMVFIWRVDHCWHIGSRSGRRGAGARMRRDRNR